MNSVTTVRDYLIIGGFVLGIIKLLLSLKTFWWGNDLSRRKVAVDLMNTWTKNLTQKSSIARKIVETLDVNQCMALVKSASFAIDNTHLQNFNFYFDIKTTPATILAGTFTVDEGQSSILRWEIVTYLNSLESVLISWRHNLADRKMLEEQFGYLYDQKANHSALEKFRVAIGAETYPSIMEFINKIETDKTKLSKGKPKI